MSENNKITPENPEIGKSTSTSSSISNNNNEIPNLTKRNLNSNNLSDSTVSENNTKNIKKNNSSGKNSSKGRKLIEHGNQTVIEYENDFSIIDLLKALLGLIILNFSLSYFVTGTPFWGHTTRLTNPRYLSHLFRTTISTTGGGIGFNEGKLPVFSESELSFFDGAPEHANTVGDEPYTILLALNGTVYDVSDSPQTYGPLGPYHIFAGRDAARAFVTGCFRSPDHLTHDLRGLDPESTLQTLAGWHRFFNDGSNGKYWKVGTLKHDVEFNFDDFLNSLENDEKIYPIPKPCDNPQPQRKEFKDKYILQKKKKLIIEDSFFKKSTSASASASASSEPDSDSGSDSNSQSNSESEIEIKTKATANNVDTES